MISIKIKNPTLLIVIICLFVILFTNCSESNKKVTITGVTELTKDGFYINGYVLTYEEIEKYDSEYMKTDLDGLKLKIKGKLEAFEMEAMSEDGEILQAREGTTTYIYDIETIEIIE